METVGKIILFVVALAVVGWLFSFFMNALAKAGNIRYTKGGRTMYSPKGFDDQIEELKRVKTFFENKIKVVKDRTMNRENTRDTTAQKIALLNELEDLRTNEVVSDLEYQQLRSDILK